VVAPGGCLAIVEFKKADTHPGPPLAIRLSAEELAALSSRRAFCRSAWSTWGLASIWRSIGEVLLKGLHCVGLRQSSKDE